MLIIMTFAENLLFASSTTGSPVRTRCVQSTGCWDIALWPSNLIVVVFSEVCCQVPRRFGRVYPVKTLSNPETVLGQGL